MSNVLKKFSVTELVLWVLYTLFFCAIVYSAIGSYQEYEPGPGNCFTITALILLIVGGGGFFWRMKTKNG